MMAQDPKAALRAKLSFEQQSRFDAQYDRQAKKQGAATVLSMPVLGTFGLEQFYLGNVGSGIIRVLFSWTLIPTVLALFEVASGDLKKQVAHANARVAQRVYDEVVKNTPSTDAAPADVVASVITPSAVAEAAAFAAEVPIAPTTTDPGAMALPFSPTDVATDAANATTPAVPSAEIDEVVITATPEAVAAAPADTTAAETEAAEVDTADRQEDVATTTAGTFTVTESAAAWQQGMDAPVVASDEQTFTVGDATDNVTDSGPTTASFVAEVATPTEDANATQPDLDAEPLAAAAPTVDDATSAGAEEGVLVFVAEDEPLASDTVMTTTVTTPDETVTETVEQQITQEQQTDQVAIAEAEHVETQHYHDGKLVEASRHDIKLTGEVSALLTDTTTDTLLQDVEARSAQAPGWLDVSPLQSDAAPVTSNASNDAPAAPVASDAAVTPTSDTATVTPGSDTTATPASDTTPAAPASDAAATATPDAPAATSTTDATAATTTDAPVDTTTSPATGDAAADAPNALAGRIADTPVRIDGGTVDGSGNGPTVGTGTDVPGGGLGGPATDVPGGSVGDPGTDPGTNVPSGGIGTPPPDGGSGDAPTGGGSPERPPHDGPIPN